MIEKDKFKIDDHVVVHGNLTSLEAFIIDIKEDEISLWYPDFVGSDKEYGVVTSTEHIELLSGEGD